MNNKKFFQKLDIVLIVLFLVLSVLFFEKCYSSSFDKMYEDKVVESQNNIEK